MTEDRFSESILAKIFYPNGAKSEKYLLKNFVCEETGKTVKNFRSDPKEPLNKLPYGQKFRKSTCDCRVFYVISADFDADRRK